jgi:hypothetical protein
MNHLLRVIVLAIAWDYTIRVRASEGVVSVGSVQKQAIETQAEKDKAAWKISAAANYQKMMEKFNKKAEVEKKKAKIKNPVSRKYTAFVRQALTVSKKAAKKAAAVKTAKFNNQKLVAFAEHEEASQQKQAAALKYQNFVAAKLQHQKAKASSAKAAHDSLVVAEQKQLKLDLANAAKLAAAKTKAAAAAKKAQEAKQKQIMSSQLASGIIQTTNDEPKDWASTTGLLPLATGTAGTVRTPPISQPEAMGGGTPALDDQIRDNTIRGIERAQRGVNAAESAPAGALFDPETGEPVEAASSVPAGVLFDPETGEQIEKAVTQVDDGF